MDWLDLGIESISFKVEIAASAEGDNGNQITLDNDNQIKAIDFCIAYGTSCRTVLMIVNFMLDALLLQITHATVHSLFYFFTCQSK